MASPSKDSAAKANLLGKRKPEDDLEAILKKHKETSEEKQTIEGRVELSETKSDQETVEEGLDVNPDSEVVSVPKKTLFFAGLSRQAEISDIIDFFKDVGQVVRVRLQLTRKDSFPRIGYVEFASADQANKALEKKKGEYLLDRRIFLDVANKGNRCLPPKYCLDHTVWLKDYPQRESLSIEDDETPPDPVEAVLFIANLSPQTTRISHIIKFFKDAGKVVSVRLIVSHEGKRVGYGFVEFASAKEQSGKNGEYLHDHKILLMKGQDKTPDSAERDAVKEKTLYVGNLSHKAKISDIINFFKDVGQVVHVRLIVHLKARHVGFGFVEFASADEAKKALEKKNGEYLHNRDIVLDVVKASPYPLRSKYCIDHKVWYEDNLRRESLLRQEDAAVEGLDETPDFAEEVAVREKTVCVANISRKKDTLCSVSHFIDFFKDVGEFVGVRIIVDHRGEHVGCGFVEFASADEAKKAVHEKNSRWISVDVAEIAPPYPFRPKYNLYKLAKKLWHEDNLRREGFGVENTPDLEKQVVFCGKKITFSDEED